MKTLQKRLKFSNGQINSRLLERTDLNILDSSASIISNFVSTPYGGVKTRHGTRYIDSVGSLLIQQTISSIATDIGGTVGDLTNDNIFTSNGLSAATDLLTFDMGSKNTYSNFKVQTISLDYSPATLTLEIDSAGTIDDVTIVDGGVGLVSAAITIVDSTGVGAILTPVTDTKGTITSVTITNGGSGYTDPVAVVTSTLPTMTINIAISDDDITYTNIGSLAINSTIKSSSFDVISDYRYIKMIAVAGIKSRLLIDKIIVSNNESASQDARYKAKIVPFEFNDNQKYLLVLKNETIDVYQDDSFLETVIAPGLKEDYFSNIKYTQNADTMIFTNPNMYPKQLQRTGIGTLISFVPTFAAGETTKSGFSIAGGGDNEYRAVDGDASTYYSKGNYSVNGSDVRTAGASTRYDSSLNDTYDLNFDSARSLTKVQLNLDKVTSYSLYGKTAGGTYTLIKSKLNSNTSFTITYDWAPLPNFNVVESVDVNATYYGLRLVLTGVKITRDSYVFGVQSYSWNAPRIHTISCYSTATQIFNFSNFDLIGIPTFAFSGETSTASSVTLTPSGTEGGLEIKASTSVFTTGSVGQKIDGNGGIFKITEYISPTKVFGYTIIPFYTANAFSTWNYITGYESVWSTTRGYPVTCLFYQQRLWFGGSKERPNTLWGSRINSYNDFTNAGNYDNDSIEATLASPTIDGIVNLYGNRGLQIFTKGSEYVATEESLTPDSISIIKNTSNGSLDRVSPVDITGTTLFIEKNGRSLLSFVYTDSQGSYITSNLSLLSNLIDAPVSMAFDYNSVRAEGNYLYIVNADGTIALSCILLDQKINSFVTLSTEGAFTDVAVVGTDVFFLVQRGTELYLEKATEDRTDNTLVKSPSQVVTGLDVLEGYSVYAYTDTENYGEFTVTSGQIDIGEVPTENLFIGIPFEYTIITNGIEINNQSQNIEKRVSRVVAVTNDTETLKIGNDEKTSVDDRFTFYSVTRPQRNCTFTISGTFDYVEILSLVLYINYGAK